MIVSVEGGAGSAAQVLEMSSTQVVVAAVRVVMLDFVAQ
jgi:hypothetical protein